MSFSRHTCQALICIVINKLSMIDRIKEKEAGEKSVLIYLPQIERTGSGWASTFAWSF